MKNLVFIDACIRDELSRTKRIATPLINKLKKTYNVITYELNKLPLNIVNKEVLTQRINKEIPEEVISWAESIRDADRVVIAAPFYDMSIPSLLKTFIELCSIFNITFVSDEKECHGNSRCEKVLYITTRGMKINTGDPLDQGTSYIKALSYLWGLGDVITLARNNMDYDPENINDLKVESAIKEGLEIIKDF